MTPSYQVGSQACLCPDLIGLPAYGTARLSGHTGLLLALAPGPSSASLHQTHSASGLPQPLLPSFFCTATPHTGCSGEASLPTALQPPRAFPAAPSR